MNISEIIRKHMIDSHELGKRIIEQISESYENEIDEFGEYQGFYIMPENIEIIDEYPNWGE